MRAGPFLTPQQLVCALGLASKGHGEHHTTHLFCVHSLWLLGVLIPSAAPDCRQFAGAELPVPFASRGAVWLAQVVLQQGTGLLGSALFCFGNEWHFFGFVSPVLGNSLMYRELCHSTGSSPEAAPVPLQACLMRSRVHSSDITFFRFLAFTKLSGGFS